MRNLVLLIIVIISFYGCSKRRHTPSNKARLTFVNNLECSDCWTNTTTVKSGIAHSGKFSTLLDANNEYSFGFKQTLKNIDLKSGSTLCAYIWAYMPDSAIKAQFVLSVDSAGKSKFWISTKIEDYIKRANKWTEIPLKVVLPPNVSPNDELKIYVWNEFKKTFYIDDFEIKIME